MTAFEKEKPLKELCTLGIGGPAEIYLQASTIDEMKEALVYCQKNRLRSFILGKGSNTLFDDRGFKGAVIHNKIDFIEEKPGGEFLVGAGYSFSLLGAQTARKGWSGLEFASGIPGTVGGAVFMNAGANGQETSTQLLSVGFVDREGAYKLMKKEELEFSYRTSSFHKLEGAIVSATFQLVPSEEARKRQLEIVDYRIKTQPYGEKSAGCMFRNPSCHHAGAMIEKCGLKGYRIGGAKVSEVHANFIVNTEEGTAQDFLALVSYIKEKVQKETGVTLESEVRVIPYEEGS